MSIRSFRLPPQRRKPTKSRRGVVVLLGVVGVVVLLTVVGRQIGRHDALLAWRRALEARAGSVSAPAWSAAWPTLPQRPGRGRPVSPALQGAYAYAATYPDRLRSIPCFCGCAREGHASVLNCFVERFRDHNAPVWTAHGLSCEMCVHIVREVMLMAADGQTETQIRTAIEEQYGK